MILFALVTLGVSTAFEGNGPTVSDPQLATGEFHDDYDYPRAAGAHVSARVTSTVFDTYVGLDMPGLAALENDDTSSGGGSYVEGTVVAAGTCCVFLTSYKAGQSGAYTLEVTSLGTSASPVASAPSTAGGLGPQLDAALRAWASGFAGHQGVAHAGGVIAFTEYDIDLRVDGTETVTVIDHFTFGRLTQTTLNATFGDFADEASALATYRALAARVQEASMPCCSFVASEMDLDGLHSTNWIPFDLTGQMGPLTNVMLEV